MSTQSNGVFRIVQTIDHLRHIGRGRALTITRMLEGEDEHETLLSGRRAVITREQAAVALDCVWDFQEVRERAPISGGVRIWLAEDTAAFLDGVQDPEERHLLARDLCEWRAGAAA